MSVHAAIEAGYTHAETAGGSVPLENLAHRADLSFDGDALVAAWTSLASPDNRHMGRGIYLLKKENGNA